MDSGPDRNHSAGLREAVLSSAIYPLPHLSIKYALVERLLCTRSWDRAVSGTWSQPQGALISWERGSRADHGVLSEQLHGRASPGAREHSRGASSTVLGAGSRKVTSGEEMSEGKAGGR